MNPTALHRLTLSTALVRQYDETVGQEIGARYAFEMANSRDQRDERIAKDTAQYEQKLKQKQWEIAQLERLVIRLTGLTVEQLRPASDDLATVLSRREEVASELRNRRLLSPVLLQSLNNRTDAEAVESKKKLDAAIAEVPTLEAHLAGIDALTGELASVIGYNDVSDIKIISTL